MIIIEPWICPRCGCAITLRPGETERPAHACLPVEGGATRQIIRDARRAHLADQEHDPYVCPLCLRRENEAIRFRRGFRKG